MMMMMMMNIDQISCRVYQYKSLLDSNGLPEECNPSHIRKFNDCQEQMEQRFNIYVDEFVSFFLVDFDFDYDFFNNLS